MAIFSRRDIQAAVDRLINNLTKQQLEGLVNRLNGTTAESLAAEWETVILSALCECGRLSHERDFGGESRPDIFFQLGKAGRLEFVADIRAISDTYAHKKNPYNDFYEAIRRFLQGHGHSSAGLHVDVGHIQEGKYGKRKLHLTLPPKDELEQFVNTELGDFLTQIARNPETNNSFRYQENGISFAIQYDASEKRGSTGHYIAYTVPYSIRNPLTNALIEKSGQLAKSGYAAAKGIIICDNGCEALNERTQAAGALGCREIVEGFLRTHDHVLWVFVLRIEQNYGFLRGSTTTLKAQFYWNPNREKSLFRDTISALERMLSRLPQLEAAPVNAAHWLNSKNGKIGRPLGGYSMLGDTIKISARALTELLAGKVTQQRFLEDHGFKLHPLNQRVHTCPFFEHQLSTGKTLKNAYVERSEHKDDDWIIFEYAGPDPAISPYRVPG